MRIKIVELRAVIRRFLHEGPGGHEQGFFDSWFLKELPGVLEDYAPDIAAKLGQQIGHGNERVVFEYDGGVIKFRPYFEDPEGAQSELQELQANDDIPITDVGIVYVDRSYDDDYIETDQHPFTLWYTMPLMKKLPRGVENLIDDFFAERLTLDDIDDPKLRTFLAWYRERPYDHAGNNVMIDQDDNYTITDV